MEKFSRFDYPITHLKMYVGAFQLMDVSEKLMAQLFQQTIYGATLK